MTELKERDSMVCRACGREERASEGYPCADCGTFICLICSFRGVLYCRNCTTTREAGGETVVGGAVGPQPDSAPA